jgi:hypothetical protein
MFGTEYHLRAVVDLEEVRPFQSSRSRALQARDQPAYTRAEAPMSLSNNAEDVVCFIALSPEIGFHYHSPEEEHSDLHTITGIMSDALVKATSSLRILEASIVVLLLQSCIQCVGLYPRLFKGR